MTIDAGAIQAMVEDYAFAFAEVTRDEIEQIVRDAAPVATGETRDAIKVEASSGGGTIHLTVDSPTDQSSYTDEGTEPHRIEGNPLLAFEMNGALVIVHSVNHPGTQAQNWFAEPMEGYLQDAMDTAAAQVQVG